MIQVFHTQVDSVMPLLEHWDILPQLHNPAGQTISGLSPGIAL